MEWILEPGFHVFLYDREKTIKLSKYQDGDFFPLKNYMTQFKNFLYVYPLRLLVCDNLFLFFFLNLVHKIDSSHG